MNELWPIYPCSGGPYAGKSIMLRPGEQIWTGAATLIEGETPVTAPHGGTYVLDETGHYLKWREQRR